MSEPLPRDSFILRHSDIKAFNDLDQKGMDKFVNDHVDERAAVSWIDYELGQSPKLVVEYVYVPESE